MRKRQRRRWWCLAIVTAFAVLFWSLDSAMRQPVQEYAVNRAQTVAGEAMAAAVEEALQPTGAAADVLYVVRNSEGAILSIETDTAAVGRLSAKVVTALSEVLQREEFSTVRIPVLNALGRVFLMGRGPKIKVCLQQNGAATVRVNSRFSEAGINQTLHRLELTVTFRAVVLAAGMCEPIETTADFLVGETVIVGTVPDRYVNFSGV